MRTLVTLAALCLTALATAAAQDFNWHGRIAAGKRLEVKGVSGDVRATLASGAETVPFHVSRGANLSASTDCRWF